MKGAISCMTRAGVLLCSIAALPSPAAAQPENSIAEEPAKESLSTVEEVLVTANRRVQNVQEIANSIRVLSGDELERSGADGFEDYIYSIPGADLVDDGSAKKIAIRGIANLSDTTFPAGIGVSPVGIYLNDTPVQGSAVPDLSLYDLQRIEVLKGPQGTLYGEGSQAGAIRMLLNKADPTEFLLKLDVGRGKTVNAKGLNRQEKFAVNVPLSDVWAIRLVGSQRLDQGYVDYPNRGTEGENDLKSEVARMHVDGEIHGLGVSIMGMQQRSRLEQYADVQFEEGDLTNRNTEDQFNHTDFAIVGLTLDWDLGFADLTSASSWFENDRSTMKRLPVLAIIADQLLGDLPLLSEITLAENEWLSSTTQQTGVAQELRLVSNSESWIQWIAGAFYRKRTNDFFSINDNDSLINDISGEASLTTFGVEEFEQHALFGEMTFDLPWDLELNLGVRTFREAVYGEARVTFGGAFIAFRANGDPEGNGFFDSFEVDTEAVTPKISLSWQVDDWRMTYLTVAQGVRSGGTNINAAYRNIAPTFEPDELTTYEVGAKTQWWNGALTVNASLFHNDWESLQLSTAVQTDDSNGPPVPAALIVNAGKAFSQGLDFEFALRPLQGLTIAFSGLIADGEIVEGDPEGLTEDGSNLPQFQKHSYAASIDYRADQWLIFGVTPSFHLSGKRVDDRDHVPKNVQGSYPLEGFKTYQARVSFSSANWDASISVNNITDERQQQGRSSADRSLFSIGRPRTVEARFGLRL